MHAVRSQGRKRARDQDASNVGKWVTFLVIVQNEGYYFGERTPRNGVRDPEQDRTVFVCQVRWKDRKPRSFWIPDAPGRWSPTGWFLLRTTWRAKEVSVRCAHGDINFYALAKVHGNRCEGSEAHRGSSGGRNLRSSSWFYPSSCGGLCWN